MNVKTWIPLALAVALGLVAMVVARKALRPAPAGPPANTVAVVVAKRDVPAGHELKAEDMAVIRLPNEAAPARGFRAVPDAVGRAVTVPIVKGQAVVESMLASAGSGSGIAALIPPGMRAITLEINEFTGLAGMLAPGARVDVICSLRDEKSQQPMARTILQNIKVLATGRNLSAAAAPEGQPAPPPSNNVTLLVTQKQAQALQLASQGSRPWLVLRRMRDEEEGKPTGTTMAEVRGDEPAAAPVNVPGTAIPVSVPAGDPFAAVPATQPAGPKGTWVVKVIRGGVPSEVVFPVEPPPAPARPQPPEAAPVVVMPVPVTQPAEPATADEPPSVTRTDAGPADGK